MTPTVKQIDETLNRLFACRSRLVWLRAADTTEGLLLKPVDQDAVVKIFDADVFEYAIRKQTARTIDEIRFHLGRLTDWGIDTSDQTVDGPVE